MAEQEQIVIDVQVKTDELENRLSGAIHSLAAMKEEQKRLTKEIRAGNDVNGTYARQLVQVQKRIEENNRAIKSNTAALQIAGQTTIDANASLDEQRQALNALQKAYAQLSGDEKKAADAQGGLRDKINELSDSVKEQEAAIGDARRNVGNYPKAWENAMPILGQANSMLGKIGLSIDDLKTNGSKAFSGLGASIKSFGKLFITPPIALIVGIFSAIMFVVNGVRDAFKRNDDAGTKLAAAFGKLEPILTAIRKAFTLLADAIAAVVNFISDAVNAIGGFFSSLFGMGDAYDAAAEAAERLVRAQDELEESQRRFVVNEAKRNKEIARLRAEAADAVDGYIQEEVKDIKIKDELLKSDKKLQQALAKRKDLYDRLKEVHGDLNKLTMIERFSLVSLGVTDLETTSKRIKSSDLLQQAIDLETENLKEKMEIAKENLRIMEEQAKLDDDTSDETKNKIAQARAAMYQAEEAYYSGVRRLKREQEREEKELEKAREERAKAREIADRNERMRRWEEERDYINGLVILAEAEATTLAEKRADILAKTKQLAQEALEGVDESEEEDDIKTPEEMARDMFGLDEEGVAYFMQLLDEGVAMSEAKTKALADQTMRMTQNWANSFGQLGSGFNQMADALGEFAGESEEAAKAQKAFALAGILTNQAQSISEGALAIAKGVESAAGIPFPANIPAIISITAQIGAMIAGVMSSIAQAKQIFAQADTQKFATGGIVGGTSYTGDNVIARLNSREMVITPDQQKVLFDAISGGNSQSLGINYEMMAAAMASVPAPIVGLRELATAQDRVSTIKEIAAI